MIKLTIEKLDLSFENVGEVAELIDTLRSKILGNENRPPESVVAEPKKPKVPKEPKPKTSPEVLDKIRERLKADPELMNWDLAREFGVSGAVVNGVRLQLNRKIQSDSTEQTSEQINGGSVDMPKEN